MWVLVQGKRVVTIAAGDCHCVAVVLPLGFRVQGSGFRVQGLAFRVQGLGFGVWGLDAGRRLRVEGRGGDLNVAVVLPPERDFFIDKKNTRPHPLYHRDDLVDRPHAMEV